MSPRSVRRPFWLTGGILGAALAACSGCVSQPASRVVAVEPPPPDTTVYFYPTQNQSAGQQDRDKYECNTWAVQQSGFDPSAPNTPPHLRVRAAPVEPPAGAGVGVGAVTGAVVGASISRPWEAGRGALIGALAGAVIGGIADAARVDQARQQSNASAVDTRAALLEDKARNFRRAMSACLEGRGYNVR